jgi:hypothetical protein
VTGIRGAMNDQRDELADAIKWLILVGGDRAGSVRG